MRVMTRLSHSNGPSKRNTATPSAIVTRNTGMPIQTADRRRLGIWVPARMNGTLNTGIATSAAVLSTDCPVSAVAARDALIPAAVSMFVCMTIPVAPPPGVIRLNAFPASCVVMTANQLRVPMAMAWTTHTQAYEAIAQTMAGTIHAVWTSPSRPHAAKTSPMLGAKKYKQIAVSARTITRPRNGRLRLPLLTNSGSCSPV